MLQMITAPAEILSKKAAPVRKIDKEILNLIEEMKKTLLSANDPEGVGLAAPQVGKPLAIFIIKPMTKSPIRVFINPEIISQRSETKEKSHAKRDPALRKKKGHTKLEGCLSLPSIWGEVERSLSITVSFMDEKGKKHTKAFKGFIATIIQHETDHLNGIPFTQRVIEQSGTLYKSHKNKKGEAVFEELEI